MKNNIDKISKLATLNPNGVIYVLSHKVVCEGPEDSKHPKVYLQIKEGGQRESNVSCGYCAQSFTFKSKNGKQ